MLLRVLVAAVAVSSVAINAIPIHGVKLESEAADLTIRDFPAMLEFEESVPVEFDLDLDDPAPVAAPAAPEAPAAPARPPVNFDFDSLSQSPLGKLKVMNLPDPTNLRNGLYKKPSPVASSDPADIPPVYSQPNFTASDAVPFTVAQPITMNITSPHDNKNETSDFIKFEKAESPDSPLGKIKTVPHTTGAKPEPVIISKVNATMGPIVVASPHVAEPEPEPLRRFTPPSFLEYRNAPVNTQQAHYYPNPAVPTPARPVHTMDPFYIPVNTPPPPPYHSTLLDPVHIRADPSGVQLYGSASNKGPLNKLAAQLRNYPADDSFVEMGGRVWRAEPRAYAQPQPRYAQAEVQMQAHEMAAAMFDNWVRQNY